MRRDRRPLAVGLALVALALPAAARAQGVEDPIPEPILPAPRAIALETIVTGLTAPNWATGAPGIPARYVFVTDQDGILWRIDRTTNTLETFLDVSDRLVPLGAFGEGTFDERGLLGLAFHPDYATNGLLYLYTSEPTLPDPDFSTQPPGVPPNHQSVITEWHVPAPTDPASRPDPASVRVLLRFDEPDFNHNAGCLNFGADAMLYISVGDGGAADDEGPGHGEVGNGRDPRTILGTILRIDPLGRDAANGQYSVPLDNPFIGQAPYGGQDGCDGDGFCDEIWAYGLRNPFRFSFDRPSGLLIAADVGQNDLEEIDVIVKGGNYGWNWKEGTFCFDGNGAGDGFVEVCQPGDVPPGLLDPIAQYDHDEGLAVIGGFVYRGTGVPGLRGRYVFGDFARMFANDGRLFVLAPNGDILELLQSDGSAVGRALLGIGQDNRGEIYLLVNSTSVPFGDTGEVLRLAPAP